MTTPLALIYYENLLPGSQLVNRLQDLNYRVLAVSDVKNLPRQAEQDRPLVVLVDLRAKSAEVCDAVTALRQATATSHLPVIGIVGPADPTLTDTARQAGVTLVASEAAFLQQLPQLLEQALAVD